MITHKNVLTVPEVSCYSREEIEGGVIIRYMVRNPGETVWRPVKVFRAAEREPEPPRRRPNAIEAAILGNRCNVAPRPPQQRTGPSVIRRIVGTIRKAQA